MKAEKDFKNTSLLRDLMWVVLVSAIASVIYFFTKDSLFNLGEVKLFSYAGVIVGIVAIVFSFFESRSDDRYVTGTMQSMGVVNSFTAVGFAIFMMAYGFGLLPVLFVSDILILVVRDLGRKSGYKKMRRVH